MAGDFIMADLLTDLHRYAEAVAVMREIARAASTPQDERACRIAAEACDRMPELVAAPEVAVCRHKEGSDQRRWIVAVAKYA
jgi:hypothetical protein